MANGPYRTVPMQIPTLRNTVRPVQLGAGPRPTVGGAMIQQPFPSTSQMIGARNMYAPQSLQAGVMSQAQPPKSQAELLAAYGLGRKPAQTVGGERRGAGAPAARTGMSGMLPASGTPEMAGLGAAGRTLMQLGGWQDKPMTLGQILGAGAEKGIEAMQARRNAMAAAEEKKAAAELAAEQEKYKREQKDKEFGLEERRTSAQERTDIDELFAGGERLGLKGQDLINFVKEQLEKKKGGTDVSVTIGDDGEPNMSLVKQQIKEQQDNIVKSVSTQDLLGNIQGSLDPKYLEVPERINQLWLAGKDKFGFASEEEKEEIRGFTRFKQAAIEAVNQYIRDITGAQMSVKEAERLSLALAQPGQGIFDGHSPAAFQEKLKNPRFRETFQELFKGTPVTGKMDELLENLAILQRSDKSQQGFQLTIAQAEQSVVTKPSFVGFIKSSLPAFLSSGTISGKNIDKLISLQKVAIEAHKQGKGLPPAYYKSLEQLMNRGIIGGTLATPIVEGM